MASTGPNADELEHFRRQWRNEVTEKQRPVAAQSADKTGKAEQLLDHVPTRGHAPGRAREKYNDDDLEPRAYHDLPDVESDLRLGFSGPKFEQTKPISALDHYEQAVEKESLGNLGESLKLYRAAFKLDDRVHEAYKAKHFPTPAPAPSASQPLNQLPEPLPNASQPLHQLPAPENTTPPTSIPELVSEYAHSEILPCEPETDLSPPRPCYIASLPEELVMQILQHLADDDVAWLSRVSLICRRFAFLIMTDQQLWRRQCMSKTIGFPAMHYEFVCDVEGNRLSQDPALIIAENLARLSLSRSTGDMTRQLLRTHYASSWRQMFRQRPRIRFGGCYISTVNYSRPGEVPANSLTWGSTIHIVTYYRYLRFFRDGTCISLLSSSEPIDVVHQLTMENLTNRLQVAKSNLPPRVMKDALRGRWRLSGPGPGLRPEAGSDDPVARNAPGPDTLTGEEAEGILHIETEAVVPRYMWRMEFALASAGRGTRNNKLAWRGFWNYNRLTDDWGEFALRNDRAYYWSRVKSYEA